MTTFELDPTITQQERWKPFIADEEGNIISIVMPPAFSPRPDTNRAELRDARVAYGRDIQAGLNLLFGYYDAGSSNPAVVEAIRQSQEILTTLRPNKKAGLASLTSFGIFRQK